jgi:hypothetical protein
VTESSSEPPDPSESHKEYYRFVRSHTGIPREVRPRLHGDDTAVARRPLRAASGSYGDALKWSI